MIMKDRARPGIEKVCDAVLLRLWPDNLVAGKLEERRKQAEAGFRGEERVDSVLAEYRHPGPIRIIPDLRLVCRSRFQLDALVLTQSWACLLEVKNISGRSVIRDIPLNWSGSPRTAVKKRLAARLPSWTAICCCSETGCMSAIPPFLYTAPSSSPTRAK